MSKLVKFFDKSQLMAAGEDATINLTRNIEDTTTLSRLGRKDGRRRSSGGQQNRSLL